MSFNACVMFTGLCAFVPNKGGTGMTCLLVNARLGRGLVDNPEHAHTPLVEFDVRNIEPPEENMTLPMIEVVDGTRGVWILDQDDLTLLPVGGKNMFEFPDSDATGEIPTEADKHLMAWVPHMGRVSRGAGPVREDLLGGDSLELRKRVAARVRIANGKMRTSKHTELDTYLSWNFRVDEDSPIYRTQVLGEIVELKLGGLDEIRLEAKRYNERTPTRQLRLKNKTGQTRLTLSFKNIELEQVSADHAKAPYPESFEDFVYFYDLAADSSAERNIPYKQYNAATAVSRPICPGAVFESPSTALIADSAASAHAQRKGHAKK